MPIDVHYVHMQQQIIVTPTEARNRFFQLLRLAEKGNHVVIAKTKNNVRFRLAKIDNSSKDTEKRLKAIEKLSNVGLKTMPWEEMKKIINTRYECSHP